MFDRSPVLLIFRSASSGYSYIIDEMLRRLDPSVLKDLKVYTADQEKTPNLIKRFKVSTFPTGLFYLKGELVDHFQGAIPFRQLEEKMRRLIGGPSPDAT